MNSPEAPKLDKFASDIVNFITTNNISDVDSLQAIKSVPVKEKESAKRDFDTISSKNHSIVIIDSR